MILLNILMLHNESQREDFNCRQRKNGQMVECSFTNEGVLGSSPVARTTVATVEVLTKDEVIELKEMYENLSDTHFNF